MFARVGRRLKRCLTKLRFGSLKPSKPFGGGCLSPLLGLDSDNGSEFVNKELLRYCQKERLTFTRARPYRKNDNCYVEQKNYSVVRQTVGYQRFDTTAELMVLKQLY